MKRMKKAAAVALALLIFISVMPFSAFAVSEQNKAQISVAVSNPDPAKGEAVTVTVSIDNYKTMSPRISAMYLTVSFDSAYFEYIADSAASVLSVNSGDITSVGYDGDESVSFAYVYANSKQNTLPTTAVEIFTFRLRVRADLAQTAQTAVTVDDMLLYNGKDPSTYSKITCKDPITETITVWPQRPPVLFNGDAENHGTYTENVTLKFDSATATLKYEDREEISITSPYVCSKNGSYSITVVTPQGTTTETFTVAKEISHISVKPGTFRTEYALGVTPDYSNGIVMVTYKDGTYTELPMDDPDISITGFVEGKTGQQTLTVKYMGKATGVTINITSKSVASFSITSPISKTEYLVGQEIEVTGGVLTVKYDDGTEDEVALSLAMLSGYDKMYVGEQSVTVTYGTMTANFKVTYRSRDAVDALIADIEAIDLAAITSADRSTLAALANRYNELSDLEKTAVVNVAKLNDAITILNSLSGGDDTQGVTTVAPSTTDAPSTTKKDDEGDGGDNLKTIWIIVAVIVGLSVVAGVAYFLFIYFKRKKELDDDEYYDDDEIVDEDGDSDLSYDDDLLNIEDEED